VRSQCESNIELQSAFSRCDTSARSVWPTLDAPPKTAHLPSLFILAQSSGSLECAQSSLSKLLHDPTSTLWLKFSNCLAFPNCPQDPCEFSNLWSEVRLVRSLKRIRGRYAPPHPRGEWPLCANIMDPVRTSVVCNSPAKILEVVVRLPFFVYESSTSRALCIDFKFPLPSSAYALRTTYY
jgi:hypothetical protein